MVETSKTGAIGEEKKGGAMEVLVCSSDAEVVVGENRHTEELEQDNKGLEEVVLYCK